MLNCKLYSNVLHDWAHGVPMQTTQKDLRDRGVNVSRSVIKSIIRNINKNA